MSNRNKKKKRQLRKQKDPWVHYKNQLRGAAASGHRSKGEFLKHTSVFTDRLSAVREFTPIGLYPQLIDWLSIQRPAFGTIFPVSKVNSYKDMIYKKGLEKISLKSELYWGCLILKKNLRTISEFVESKRELTNVFLSGSQENIEASIQNFKDKFGLSIWLLQLEIASKQFLGGLELQKEFVKNIREKSSGNLVPYIAWHTSSRNEDTVTIESFKLKYCNSLEESNMEGDMLSYMRFRIANIYPVNLEELGDIIRIEYCSSIYDLYESMIAILQTLAINWQSQDVESNFLVNKCIPLIDTDKDARLKKISFLLSNDDKYLENLNKSDTSHFFNLYQKNMPLEKQHDFDENEMMMLFYFKTLSCGDKLLVDTKSLKDKLISHTVHFWGAAEKSYEAKSGVDKIANNFIGLNFSKKLIGEDFLEYANPAGRNASLFLNSDKLCPLDIMTLRNVSTSHLINAYRKIFKGDPLFKWVSGLHGNLNSRSETELFFFISIKYNEKEYDDCIELSKDLHKMTNNLYLKNQASRYEVFSTLNKGSTTEAIKKTVALCCERESMIPLLPIYQMVSGGKWDYYESILGEIFTPIILHIYTNLYVDEMQSDYLRDCWDEFVESQNCRLASELDISKYSRYEIIYFLKYVCVSSIMDVSIAFSGSSELEGERMKICNLLSDIDADNLEEYKAEIKEITKSLEINKGIREIDSSRVHVSVESLRVIARRDLSDLFKRYKKLSETFERSEDFERAISDYAKKDTPIPEQYWVLPESESNDILIEIINSIKNEFLNNSHHGLDSFLSMRIRHGTLAGFLTSPLEQHNFNSFLDDKSELVGTNYWFESIGGITEKQKKEMLQAFTEFHEKHTLLIQDLAQEKLHIKSKEKPKGIFDIVVNAYACHLIAYWMPEIDDFDDMFDSCVDVLWTLLSTSLENAIHIFKVDSKNIFEINLETLKRQLVGILNEQQLQASGISRSLIDLSISMQTALDSIGDWFDVAGMSSFNNTYDMDTVVDIASLQVMNVNRGFYPIISKKIIGIEELHSQSMHNITDILFIIFDNAFKHSGKLKPWINVSAELNEAEAYVLMKVESEIDSNVKTADAQEKIAQIRADIKEKRVNQKIKSEGSSGFYKLSRFVSDEVADPLVFDFADKSSFKVEIKLTFVLKEFEKIKGYERKKTEI